MKQLALPFLEAQTYAAEDFCAAPSNAAARDWLARPGAWTNGRLILWGEAGCGKTHLLHLWAASVNAEIMNGATLQGLIRPTKPFLAIDDADIVVDPRTLLHLLNAASESATLVLMTSRLPPARQQIKLADLSSRLRATTTVEIRAPEDELFAMLLARLAADRQLNLSIPVSNFLLTHVPRTAAALREAVARLDRATLGQGIRITRQLADEILVDLAHE
jgi:chromosomal replication initiation ATPase DnaA